MQIITLRALLVDCRPVRKKGVKLGFVSQEGQYRTIAGKEDSSTGQSSAEDRYCGQREYLRKKNSGVGIQDREHTVSSLCGVTNNCSSAR
jgi:hypothetical protein